MAKIDLHVHSRFSEHPSEWFLQRIGAQESYTYPEYVHAAARSRGMDYVTITDHNRIDGALQLKERFPDEVIVGVETTTYFPEDGCKIHVLIYGIDERQFATIQELRENIYDLRAFIHSEDLAHSVAHATYSINVRLEVNHLERLIPLFDVFEGINGARDFLFNSAWMEILSHLTPEHIEKLQAKHGITPLSCDPWNKAFTGGSDDHAGLFIGQTCSWLPALSASEVLECLKAKQVAPDGRHNDYKSLAFALYKIASDFARSKDVTYARSFVGILTEKTGLVRLQETHPERFREMGIKARTHILSVYDLAFSLESYLEVA